MNIEEIKEENKWLRGELERNKEYIKELEHTLRNIHIKTESDYELGYDHGIEIAQRWLSECADIKGLVEYAADMKEIMKKEDEENGEGGFYLYKEADDE